MMKTQLGAPFSVRRVPLNLTQMPSFFVFLSECGKHIYKQKILLSEDLRCLSFYVAINTNPASLYKLPYNAMKDGRQSLLHSALCENTPQ